MVVLCEQTQVHPHCSLKPSAVVLHQVTDGSLMQRQPLPLGKGSASTLLVLLKRGISASLVSTDALSLPSIGSREPVADPHHLIGLRPLGFLPFL